MEWVILFVVSWVLFIAAVDWRKLKLNIWSGCAAIVLQLIIDTQAIQHKYYTIANPVFKIWGSSVFFTFGPVFVVGTLLSQYHPTKRWVVAINAVILAILYSLSELLLVYRGNVIYLSWAYFGSLLVNLGILISMSWFCIVVLNKKVGDRV